MTVLLSVLKDTRRGMGQITPQDLFLGPETLAHTI